MIEEPTATVMTFYTGQGIEDERPHPKITLKLLTGREKSSLS
ncbi:hypothetical protein [Stygiolobus caldivivus]|nr:hypothetical protein [Stygiolobus caldivivus]